jgi:hypothetical protein
VNFDNWGTYAAALQASIQSKASLRDNVGLVGLDDTCASPVCCVCTDNSVLLRLIFIDII